MINWKLCKKFKFGHANKLYIYNPEISSGECDTHTSLGFRDTNRSPNLGWRLGLTTKNESKNKKRKKKRKRTWRRVNFTIPADHRLKLKERVSRNRYLNLAREIRKNNKKQNKKIGAPGIIPKYYKTSGDHLDESIIKIGMDTETIPGDLLSLKIYFGLVCLVLWHINLCWLFNAKSIFM